jgi:hypothetical protein
VPLVLAMGVATLIGCTPPSDVRDQGNEGSLNADDRENESEDRADQSSDAGTENPPGDQPDAQAEPSGDALSDFSVSDVNPASARYEELISPRDYLGQISAWYFGHST